MTGKTKSEVPFSSSEVSGQGKDTALFEETALQHSEDLPLSIRVSLLEGEN